MPVLLVAAVVALVLAQIVGIVGLRVKPRADMTFDLLVFVLIVTALVLAGIGLPRFLRGG